LAKSKFGQNFLIDKKIIRRVINAAKLSQEDTVLEIGAGHGELTGLIAEKAEKVFAVERDNELCRSLHLKFSKSKNVELVKRDILKLDIGKLAFPEKENHTPGHRNKLKIIGNLPYYITSPILMKLFRSKDYLDYITIIVQKEVSDRMAASPGSRSYSTLSLAVHYHAKIEHVFPISSNSFRPQPEVDSSLISMSIRKKAPVDLSDEESFFRFVKGIFGGRRKMLYNAISRVTPVEKKDAEKLLLKIDIDPRARPETISLNKFANIFETIKRYSVQ